MCQSILNSLYYKLYCQTVVSDVNLHRFGVKQLTSPISSDLINLEFILSTRNDYIKYTNHQTYSEAGYGYYFIENIAFFEIIEGKKIVVNYFNEIDDDLIHTLLNYPFAILFNQRKKYVIHASSVIYENKVFCFVGNLNPKSSLASHLIERGSLYLKILVFLIIKIIM